MTACSSDAPTYTRSAQALADHFVAECEKGGCNRSDFAAHVDGEAVSRRLESSIRRADSYDLQVLPDEIGEDGARLMITFEAEGQPNWTQTIHLSNEMGPWEITSGTPREGVETVPGAAETEQPTP